MHRAAAYDGLAGGEVGERADDRDEALVVADCSRLGVGALGGAAGDGGAALRVLAGEALHHAAQLAKGAVGHSIVPSCPDAGARVALPRVDGPATPAGDAKRGGS